MRDANRPGGKPPPSGIIILRSIILGKPVAWLEQRAPTRGDPVQRVAGKSARQRPCVGGIVAPDLDTIMDSVARLKHRHAISVQRGASWTGWQTNHGILREAHSISCLGPCADVQ